MRTSQRLLLYNGGYILKKRISSATAANRFLLLGLLVFFAASMLIGFLWPTYYIDWPSPLREVISYVPAMLGFGLMSFFYMKRHGDALLPDQPVVKKSSIFKVMLMAVCGILIMLPINLIMMGLAEFFNIPQAAGVVAGDSFLELLVALIIYALCPAVMEEYMFRGVLMRANQPNLGKRAVIYSAVIFGLMHMNPVSLISLTLIGVFIGIVLRETGSLFLCMVYHMTHNGLIFIIQHIAAGASGGAEAASLSEMMEMMSADGMGFAVVIGVLIALAFYIALAVGAFFGLMALSKSIRNPEAIKNEEDAFKAYELYQKNCQKAKETNVSAEKIDEVAIEEGAIRAAVSVDSERSGIEEYQPISTQKTKGICRDHIAYGCYILSIAFCVIISVAEIVIAIKMRT